MYKTVFKYLLIILASVALQATPAYAQMKKITGEPVNIGVVLVNQDSLDGMVETCEYNHLASKGVDDSGYTVYRHPDGSIIRFKISTQGDKIFPIVEVTTKKKTKDVEKFSLSCDSRRLVMDMRHQGKMCVPIVSLTIRH